MNQPFPHQPDFQPTLTGPAVVIRPVRADDWTDMFAAASDPLIWAVHPAKTRYREEEFRQYFDNAIASKMAFTFIERATGAIIGSSRYHGYDPARSEIEIGWTFLVCRHWGGPTNREIKTLMINHAFGFVDTVVFFVGAENARSRKAMEKIGGVLRDGVTSRLHNGIEHKYVVYEINKPAR